jgi:hypothetical protein
MAVIDIGTVLNKINDTYDENNAVVKHYGLMFITADGRVRTMDARKNVKSPKQELKEPLRKRAKGLFNLQRHGTILLEDLARKEARTVKVATIFGFKDFKQSVWHNVRH